MYQKPPRIVNDDVWTFNTQSSSQWDGLRHFGYQKEKVFYNGVTLDDIHGEHATNVNGIHGTSFSFLLTGVNNKSICSFTWFEVVDEILRTLKIKLGSMNPWRPNPVQILKYHLDDTVLIINPKPGQKKA